MNLAKSPHAAQSPVASIHSLPVSEVYSQLGSRPGGLSQAEAKERLQQYGPNLISKVKGKPLWVKFLANFTHLMALLLWVGGIVGFIAGMPQLGIAIWLVNIINGVFSFWQEFKAEKATEALREMLPSYTRVMRDGEVQRILAQDLAPGDVILIEEGDRISADARLVDENELRADQSTLSGESHPVRKTCEAVLRDDLTRSELPNLIYAGTTVAAGTGRAVVFATAMNTEFGKIAHLTQTVGDELSPLQKEMARVTKIVSIMAASIGVFFFILAIFVAGVELAESFIFAMGMIVAFVPEGMLPTVTLSLAMGVQRMARRNALIKKLSAVETLGCTTVICTDKTGTLTQNEMTVTGVWLPGGHYTVTGAGYSPQGKILPAGAAVENPVHEPDLRFLLLAAGLCNNSRLVPPDSEHPQWTHRWRPDGGCSAGGCPEGRGRSGGGSPAHATPARAAVRFAAQAHEYDPFRAGLPAGVLERGAQGGSGVVPASPPGRPGAASGGCVAPADIARQ